MKKQACAFIGHKPQKFHFGYDELYEDCLRLKAVLAWEIKAMLAQGVTTFYTGMSLGADMWCAEIVLALREELPQLGIELIAVIPFEGQANRWSNDYRERYFSILDKAQAEICLQAHYSKGCLARATAIWRITPAACWPYMTAARAKRAVPWNMPAHAT
ncbi:MAG: SLOG family protein [Candidatus Pelethousia sp.]|nr:SLOG family protein [Candidatus Pelethousia sp.]